MGCHLHGSLSVGVGVHGVFDMSTKTCRGCTKTFPISEFYENRRMKDGHLNYCKECCANKAILYHSRDDYREMRLETNRRYLNTPNGKEQKARSNRRARERHPEKERARDAVEIALKCGRLVRLPCCLCGDAKSEAHHADYSKPLDVTWVCFRCHREKFHGQKVLQP